MATKAQQQATLSAFADALLAGKSVAEASNAAVIAGKKAGPKK